MSADDNYIPEVTSDDYIKVTSCDKSTDGLSAEIDLPLPVDHLTPQWCKIPDDENQVLVL